MLSGYRLGGTGTRSIKSGARWSDKDKTAGHRLGLRDYFTLRPYRRDLITPAASVWLGSAWTVILLMAGIEGFVWGAVGASLVPSATQWLAVPVAGFMFVLMFSIIWIVDASLIMSERPSLRLRRRYAAEPRGIGPTARWLLGLLVRVAIVAVSLYVTAPFIEKLVRADDIAGWHQARIEDYFKERGATIQAQVQARAEQMDAGLTARIASLEQEIQRLSASLQAERDRRKAIEAEYAPETEVLTRDLAEARARVGDELLGRDGRPEGYGPEARKWDARAKLIQQELSEIQAERDARLAGTEAAIAEQQQRLVERSDALEQVRIEQAQLLARVTEAVTAEQPPANPPRLTFAARSKGLSALRNSPDEAGVPHFETVEGFAQAALGILFFALIALKLFEPSAVQAYYSESVQAQYRKYLAGGLQDIPGFDHHEDPARRLSPAEFVPRWERYERDPDAYFEQMQVIVGAEGRARRLLADQAYELELLERQRETLDERMARDLQRQEAAAEEELRQQRQRFEDAREAARDETRQRRMALDDQRLLREIELRQAATDSKRTQERAGRELRIEQSRALLADELKLQSQQRAELSELRMRLSRADGVVVTQRSQQQQLQEQRQEQARRAEALRDSLEQDASKIPAMGSTWRIADPARTRRRQGERQLRRIEAEGSRLLTRDQAVCETLTRLEAEQETLRRDIAERESDLAASDLRIGQYRRQLESLLLRRV